MNNFGDNLSGGLAGPTALLFIVLIGIGTVFLIRNMNSRLRRLPDRFDSHGPEGPSADQPDRGEQ